MTPQTTRVWLWLHKWSSLICTVFMLLLCLTGLPLIFHHELGHWLGTEMQAPPLPAGVAARAVTLDEAVAVAQRVHPDRVAQYASPEEDSDDLWRVTMAPTPAPTDDFRLVVVDARTGDYLGTPPLHSGFLWIMFKLHVDLFAGLAGKLFLGLMGVLLLVSLISGTVLYAPFMRKLAFGTVRRGSDRPASRQEDDRARKQRAAQRRLKWLDLHNLLGIVLLAWLFVVGGTGVINTWADLLVKYWQHDQLSAYLAPYKGQPTVPQGERAPIHQALHAAQEAVPDTRLYFMAFPGTAFASPHHYVFFMRGNTPLTAHLPRPVLVDARTAQVTAAPRLPWYLTALLMSRPLHFGDYGGWPMQILWALLDVLSIIVLGSGLYLWLKKGNKTAKAGSVQQR